MSQDALERAFPRLSSIPDPEPGDDVLDTSDPFEGTADVEHTDPEPIEWIGQDEWLKTPRTRGKSKGNFKLVVETAPDSGVFVSVGDLKSSLVATKQAIEAFRDGGRRSFVLYASGVYVSYGIIPEEAMKVKVVTPLESALRFLLKD